MKIRLNEDYYFWCCDWCDSENLVLWAKLQDGTFCGACHRPMNLPDKNGVVINSTIAAGLYSPREDGSIDKKIWIRRYTECGEKKQSISK